MMAAVTMSISTKSVKKANRAVMRDCGMLCPLTLMGSTALGCMICRKLLRNTLSSITPRMHLKPPLVLPAQAPRYISRPNSIHVICGQRAMSSLSIPVVVINDTTWNKAWRKLSSRS